MLLSLESLRSFYNLASGQQHKSDRKGALTHASGDQITPLVGRLFSHLTITLGSVRFYAAHHIHNGPVYDLALSTYVVGLAFMFIELYVCRSMSFGSNQAGAVLLASCAAVWMFLARDYYIS